ncbi:MAG: sterol desaturase family protein [Pseudomonadales bacterium]
MQQSNQQSIRLFKNDFMETLTHVHPIVPLAFWGPIAAFLIWRTFATHGLALAPVAGTAVAGLATWSLTEYSLHRFVFHFPARSQVTRYLVFLFHGVHHDTPNDKTRLVMPPAGAVIIMLLLWFLFGLFIPAPWIEPFCAFFIIGYLIYDYIHYACHHFAMRHPLLRYLKHYHLKHHFSGENARYGVSSPLWDRVFRTFG